MTRPYSQKHTELVAWLECVHTRKDRVRRNWATVFAFVRVYPYALFWHAYVGEKLCASGGKWAESDRVAFEYDCSDLCH